MIETHERGTGGVALWILLMLVLMAPWIITL